MKEQLAKITQTIEQAAQTVGKSKQDIMLIGVSKTYPIEAIEKAYHLGITHFGENKVQELMAKQEQTQLPIQWHFIGHLQRNKVKYLIGKVVLIHSVDSLKLAKEIQKESKKKGVTTSILLEVNVAKEPSKYGFYIEDVVDALKEIATYSHVKVEGLMTVAPYVEDPELNRSIFRKLFQLSVDIQNQNIDNISTKWLSMGMSNDYHVAIEEGASSIRVGTALFGIRDYSKELE